MAQAEFPTPGETVTARRLWPRLIAARLWREPLLHFLVLGAAIFALAQHRERADDPRRIVVGRDRVAGMAQAYADEYGQPPSPATLDGLIARYVEQEALYREGKALGLDREDEVVRRRIVQKTEFLQQDLNPPAEPDEAALRRFHRAHAANYTVPARLSFTHIYFSPDRGGEAAAQARAARVLAGLDARTLRAPERGDRFADLYDYAGLSAQAAERIFGRSDLASVLFRTPPGRWTGPFRSGYGWHLVRVTSAEPPALRRFDEVREEVRTDLLAQSREAANRQAMADLRRRYEVVVETGAHP